MILSKKSIKTPHNLPMSQSADWKPSVLWIKLSVLWTTTKLNRCTQIKEKESQGAQSEAAQVHVCNSTFRAWQLGKNISVLVFGEKFKIRLVDFLYCNKYWWVPYCFNSIFLVMVIQVFKSTAYFSMQNYSLVVS